MAKTDQGVAKTASRKKAGTEKKLHAGCGGELVWSMFFNLRGPMKQVCGKCGTIISKQ